MIGRQRERGELRALLGGTPSVVTLTGPGGIGKSVLARAGAEEARPRFPDGVAYVQVSDLGGPEGLEAAVAEGLGLHRAVPGLVEAVGDRRALLVLDGCDRLVDACASLVAALAAGAPSLVVLSTTRQPLGVPGESVLRLGPLEYPDPSSASPSLDRLAELPAVELFVAAAQARVPSFRLTPENGEAVARLCAALDGVPLALELAAARVTVLSPHELLGRLEEPLRLLASLRASIDLGFELCTPAEQALWARLGVFRGSFDLTAAEMVCPGDGLEEADILDGVDGLLERSVLVREDDDPRTVRYRMPEPVRTYAAERLDPSALARWRDRHLEWCVRQVADTQRRWFGADQADLARRLRRDRANLGAALDHAVEQGRAADALTLAAGLGHASRGDGRTAQTRAWLDQALALDGAPATARLEARLWAVWFALVEADVAAASRHLASADALAAETGLASQGGRALAAGGLAMARGDIGAALAEVTTGVAQARLDHDRPRLAIGLILLGCCRSLGHDEEGAAVALSECVALTARAGESELRTGALGLLAFQSLRRGDLGGADDAGRRALALAADLGDRFAVACLVLLLSGVAAAAGEHERAAILLGASDAQWRLLGSDPEVVCGLAPLRRDAIAHTRAGLGVRLFATRRRAGAELTERQVVPFAVDDVVVDDARPAEPDVPLTPRELEIAELLGRGLTNPEIARRLVISPRTVQGHVENILRKLGFSSRSQVAAWVGARTSTSGAHG